MYCVGNSVRIYNFIYLLCDVHSIYIILLYTADDKKNISAQEIWFPLKAIVSGHNNFVSVYLYASFSLGRNEYLYPQVLTTVVRLKL